ncbi:MAG TPA: YhjD/YihY/BrkB family envelope integrity protein, partial [Nocardioides sp.]
GEPQWQEQILNSALSQFPIIGDELGRPEGLQGSVAGVAIGAIAALYGAMGLGQALQNTQHVAWSVPRNSRPNPLYARVKTLILLLTAGFSLLAVSVVSTVASTTDLLTETLGQGIKLFLPVLTIAVVGTFLTFLFRFAATGQHSFGRAAPGGYTLAVMWQLLQLGGAAYVDRVLVDTSSMTKTFGLVLGLIGFLWIGAVMAVLAMEVNVVWSRRLWPRALLTPFTDNVDLTDADRRAYASYARMQRHKGFETVQVVWKPGPAEKPRRE